MISAGGELTSNMTEKKSLMDHAEVDNILSTWQTLKSELSNARGHEEEDNTKKLYFVQEISSAVRDMLSTIVENSTNMDYQLTCEILTTENKFLKNRLHELLPQNKSVLDSTLKNRPSSPPNLDISNTISDNVGNSITALYNRINQIQMIFDETQNTTRRMESSRLILQQNKTEINRLQKNCQSLQKDIITQQSCCNKRQCILIKNRQIILEDKINSLQNEIKYHIERCHQVSDQMNTVENSLVELQKICAYQEYNLRIIEIEYEKSIYPSAILILLMSIFVQTNAFRGYTTKDNTFGTIRNWEREFQ